MTKATTAMRNKSAPKAGKGEASPSRLIDARIKDLGDWRGETLARVRMKYTDAVALRRSLEFNHEEERSD
jgi:hypothetical protein